MTPQEAHAAVLAAQEELERLQAEYGEALADGKASAALKAKVQKAEAALEDAQLAAKVIQAATVRAEQAERDASEAVRQADIEAKWSAAEHAVHDLRATGEAIDRTLEKLATLMQRAESQGRSLIAEYGSLGMNGGCRTILQMGSWNGQILQRMKTDTSRGMRMTMDRVLVSGTPAGSVASKMPPLERLFPGRVQKKDAA
ncbi:hypothetical protein [Chelativorans salis]|uniref:Uncharacterized protein n=1 Tax=Chelativorans salis TaxID=2978478 RepID=A0ABT2LMC4_9HYPH|nr:hypothetical protein [Chelativorans sp. EGI FJ00035]MCT7375730.1 hypothetical protein [Chelativorans sp. EGI FJ00035]